MPCTQGKASVFVNFSPVADTDHQDDHPYIKGGMASLAKGRRIPLWEGFDPTPVLDSLCEDAKARADKLPKGELPQPGIPGEEQSPPGIFWGDFDFITGLCYNSPKKSQCRSVLCVGNRYGRQRASSTTTTPSASSTIWRPPPTSSTTCGAIRITRT